MSRSWLGRLLSIAMPSLLLGIIIGVEPDNSQSKPLDDPPSAPMPRSAYDYAKMCEAELGVPPRVILDQAVEIPLYVDGTQKYGNLGYRCDNPSFLGKSNVSGSTLQRHPGRTADGKPLPDVFWISFGRNSSPTTKRVVGSVQMIGYNQKTGATAFFESCDQLEPWVTLDSETWRMKGTMPWIDEPEEFNRAFVTPISRNIQCVQCHQNDPFITNDFINAAKMPGTKEAVVPALSADAPYYVIGAENWDMRTIHIEDNACFDCHRVGMSTMRLFMENGWNPNEHMPPNDPGSLDDDLQELLTAWEKGPENVAGATWILPPSRGSKGRNAGPDYPNKAHFNNARLNYGKQDKKLSVEKENWEKTQGDKGQQFKGVDSKLTPEVKGLLNRLKDSNTRKGFEYWIRENGLDQETLEKLRDMADSAAPKDGKTGQQKNRTRDK